MAKTDDDEVLAVIYDMRDHFPEVSVNSIRRSVERHWHRKKLSTGEKLDAIITELTAKQSRPCFIFFSHGSIAEYMRKVPDRFYPSPDSEVDPSGLPPWLREEALATRGANRAFYKEKTPVSWREVKTALRRTKAEQKVHVIVVSSPEPPTHYTVEAYESVFEECVLKEEVRRVVGVFATADQLMPFVDYCGARLNGRGGEEMREIMAKNSVTWSQRHHPESTHYFTKEEEEKKEEERTANAVEWPEDPPGYLDAVVRRPLPKVRNIFGNSFSTAISSRQNKGNAQHLLRLHRLNYIRSVEAMDAATAEQKRREAGLIFPLIVKPIIGAGAEFIFLCHNKEEMTVAFDTAASQCTTQRTIASHMTVEEYIDGPEYVVNTVAYRGTHVVTDVWKSVKFTKEVYSSRLPSYEEKRRMEKGEKVELVHSTTLLHDYQELVPSLAALPPDSEVRRVVDYTLECVKALGSHQGCTHCEVRVDDRPDSPRRGQPVLIELNPRMQGSTPRGTPLVGYDQFSLFFYLAAVSELYPEAEGACTIRAKRRYGIPWPPAPLLYSGPTSSDVVIKVVFLISEVDGVLCGQGARRVMQLPTYQYCTRGNLFEPRDSGYIASVQQTMDLLSSPGAIVLQGGREEVERDTQAIRDLERLHTGLSALIVRLSSARSRQTAAPYDFPDVLDWESPGEEVETVGELRDKVVALIESSPPLFIGQIAFRVLVQNYLGTYITLTDDDKDTL